MTLASGSYDERAAHAQVEATMPSDVPQAPHETPEKDPQDWTTGEEPMTGPQRSYLQTLAQEAGESVPDALTKAEASRLIDRLQHKTGRGR